MSTAELIVGGAVFGVITVFMIALRYVSRATRRPAVPQATIALGGGARWLEGRGRARMAGRAEAWGRVAVACGLTGIAIMVACLLGIIVVAVAA